MLFLKYRSNIADPREGVNPALEPSYALAYVMKIVPDLPSDHIICGGGEKDIFTVSKMREFWKSEIA